MRFKYSQYPTPDGKNIYRPSVPIVLKNGSSFILVEAVIDSGADFTIFPIEIAGVLNLKLDKNSKKTSSGPEAILSRYTLPRLKSSTFYVKVASVH
jgi:hypothetical protein